MKPLPLSRIRQIVTGSLFTLAVGLSLAAGTALAQDAAVADKSGTNPINFTYDARLYNEYQWLNAPGDASRNITTFEYRQPFADGKWQFRTRLRATHLDMDSAGVDQFGLGDMDVRFLTVPYMNVEKKQAAAIGLETFIPTGSNDVLSSNALSFGPQVFYIFLAPFGGAVDLIAPGYQHQFSVFEESGTAPIHQSNLDLFILKTFNNKQQWLMVNPQGVIDYQNKREIFNLDVEFGTMLEQTDNPGDSFYVRPAVGIGGDRAYDASIEAGYKVVW